MTVRPGCLEGYYADILLFNLLKAHAVGHKWFSFLQGLEPCAVIPPRILVAGARQPV